MSSFVESAQKRELSKLLRKGAQTEYGKRYGFSDIAGHEQYRENVPLSSYDDIESYIERMKMGERNLLWPGRIDNFAVSAGTTGKGKHIPLSEERLRSDQRFMRMVIISYMKQSPHFLTFFLGSHVSLPGNIERLDPKSRVRLGEISGYLAKLSPGWLSIFQVRPPRSMIQESWSEKFDRTLKKAVKADVRQMTTTPFWALRFIQEALKITGKKHIREVWPNLRLFISGGESLSIYRPHLDMLLEGLDVDYVENYGASESYLAYSDDLKRNDLRLVVDNGSYYEWIPWPQKNRDNLREQKAIPTWQVEEGVPYGLVVTSNSGLWRYMVNDVIRFTDTRQPRIEVTGRISEIFDRFGEAVEAYEAQKALELSSKKVGASFSMYSMGGMIDPDIQFPRHYWFVQWANPPEDMDRFTQLLDENLREINRHYSIRRDTGLGLPVLMPLTAEALNAWRKKHQTVQAQTKMPRIIEDEQKLKDLIELCRNHSGYAVSGK